MSKSRKSFEEPWSPQAIIVDALIDPSNTYVNNFSKRQAKGLSEARACLSLISRYITPTVTWIDELVTEFEKRNKFINGWAVKEASKIARSHSTRFLLNLSRWRRLLLGGEEEVG